MSTSEIAPEPIAPEPQGMSEIDRLSSTFFAPSRTMEDIARNTSWWVPWLLLSVISLGFAFAVDKRIGWENVVEQQIMKDPKAAEQFEKMAPEQREKSFAIGSTIGKVFAYGSPVLTLVGMAVIAGVLLGVFNFGFGAQLRFPQLMAISFYANLVGIIKGLLSILMMFLVEPGSFNLQNPVASNLGVLVDQQNKFAFRAVTAFDVFSIWVVALVALGISRNSKVKWLPAFITVFVLFFLAKLIGMAG